MTRSTVRPAWSAGWNLALCWPGLHPIQDARGVTGSLTVLSLQKAVAGGLEGAPFVPRYEATAMRSLRFMVNPTAIMTPASSARRMRAEGIACSAVRDGIRSPPCSWHVAQRFW